MITPQRDFLKFFIPTMVCITLVFVLIVGCPKGNGLFQCGQASPAPAVAPVVLQPDNEIDLPKCRTMYIGQCPYLWCINSVPGLPSGLVPMREHCDPGNAVVSSVTRPR